MKQDTTPNQTTKSRPVQEIRCASIKAAIWQNETELGPRYNVTFERLYRDGNEWRSTTSFGRDDLLLLGKVADQAHTWILTTGQEINSQAASGDSNSLSGAALPRKTASM